MEIKTTKNPREPLGAEPAPVTDKSHYLRRKAIQKVRKGHGWTQWIAALLPLFVRLAFLALLVAFGRALYDYSLTSERFTVRAITFAGCKQTDTRALEEMIRGSFPRNLLRIDLVELRNRIESVPWAKRAEIRRVLPSDLIIRIEERAPAAILEIQGDLMLADDEGILLDRYDSRHGKLDVPVFKGFLGTGAEGYRQYQHENSERVMLGRKMVVELEEGSSAFARSISEVDLSDKTDVRILLVDDTAEIHLGDKDFLKRFQTFMANMHQYQDLKTQYEGIASIDLRFEGQVIYRPIRAAGPGSAINMKPAPER